MPITFSIGREKSSDRMKKARLWEVTPRGRSIIESYTGTMTPKMEVLAALKELNVPSTTEEIANASHLNKKIVDMNLTSLQQMQCAQPSKMGGERV